MVMAPPPGVPPQGREAASNRRRPRRYIRTLWISFKHAASLGGELTGEWHFVTWWSVRGF